MNSLGKKSIVGQLVGNLKTSGRGQIWLMQIFGSNCSLYISLLSIIHMKINNTQWLQNCLPREFIIGEAYLTVLRIINMKMITRSGYKIGHCVNLLVEA